MEASEVPNVIQKQILLRAPLARVWRAVSDATAFGAWFGVAFEGPFVAGSPVRGHIVPTQVDAAVAALQEPHRGLPFDWTVIDIEPMSRITFRWHPFAIDRDKDYSQEPATLICFDLTQEENATRLTITESGFKDIPLERRVAAFTANDGGWEHQSKLIAKYLALHGG